MVNFKLTFCFTLVLVKLLAQPAADMPVAKYKDNATPYPLYAGLFGSTPNYQLESIKILGENFDAFYGNFNVDMATADAVRKFNPNFSFVKYQGAWQLSGQSRIKVEQEKSLVLHYRIGNLATDISSSQTKFSIDDIFGNIIPSTSDIDKSIGYIENGVFKYVTWLRIGDEIIKIINVDASVVTVIRGFDNTIPKSYLKGSAVLSPVYGTPPTPLMKAEVTYRNDEATTLRWDNIYTSLEAEYLKNKGGVWIDIIVGNLSQFAQSGESIPANRIWDLKNQKVYDAAFRASKSEEGIRYIQEKFKAKFGVYPVIWGNNMLFPTDINDSRIKMLMTTNLKTRPLDGFAQENSFAGYGTGGNSGDVFEWTSYAEWKKNLQSIIFMGEQKLAAVPLIMDGGQDNGTFAKLPEERKHKLFMYSYASYLLAVKVESDNRIFTKLGFTPILNDNNKISFQLDPCFKWDIGKPSETLKFNEFESYKIPDKEIWVRRFENGIVLVNPTDTDQANINLDKYGTAFFNPDTKTNFIQSISLPEHSGAILLYENITSIVPNENFTIYPNPANEILNIKHNEKGKYILDIFYPNGTLAITQHYDLKENNSEINVPIKQLPASMYIIQFRSVKNNNFSIVKRFIKK